MDYNLKLFFSTLAIALTLFAFFPYIRSILLGETKPHVFSWIIWGLTTTIVFFAQIGDKAGIGAWPIGLSGLITLSIAVLAFLKRSDISITRIDYLFFSAALMSLPFWYFTSEPLWAVLILTIVDLLGFGPTIRKVYDSPYSENQTFFVLFALRNILVVLALEHYSVTTVLFPISVAVACFILLALINYRRKGVDA